MSRNKVYTQSYFVKRLLEEGFDVRRLHIEFEEKDTRKWMILVNFKDIDKKCNVIIICNKVSSTDYCFKLIAPHLVEISVKTQSMQIIIENLKNIYFNILTQQIL